MILRFFLILFICYPVFTAEYSLEILNDSISPDGINKLPFYKFKSNSTLTEIPVLFVSDDEETLNIDITNTDNAVHKIYFEAFEETLEVGANSTASISLDLKSVNQNSISFYDIAENEKYKILGLYGSIEISELNSDNLAFWHLKEIDSKLFQQISEGSQNFEQQNYNPDYFLLNYKYAPHIYSDAAEAKVNAKVGEKFRIHIVNTGNSIHSLHFHGFHVNIIESSRKDNFLLNSEKDTFPVYPGENIIVEMIPDKPGRFPVHDHNLVATTSNNIYPNGIFTIMDVVE